MRAIIIILEMMMIVTFASPLGADSHRESCGLDGVYIDKSETLLLRFIGNNLIIRRLPSRDSYDMAVFCRISHETCNFIEINSINSYITEGIKNCRIEYDKPNDRQNYLIIDVKLPNFLINEFDLKVSCNDSEYIKKGCIGSCNICIPDHVTTFRFNISPTHYVMSNPYGQYFGIMEFTYPYEVKTYGNNIRIELPDITWNYFNQWVITNEIMKIIDHDAIEWNNNIYRRTGSKSIYDIIDSRME